MVWMPPILGIGVCQDAVVRRALELPPWRHEGCPPVAPVNGPLGARGEFVLTVGQVHPCVRPVAAGLDEVRGSTPKSPQRAPGRLVPVGLVDPRSDRLVIMSHHPHAIRPGRALVRCRAEPRLCSGGCRVGAAARQHRPGDARGLIGQGDGGEFGRLALQQLRCPASSRVVSARQPQTAVAPMTSRWRR